MRDDRLCHCGGPGSYGECCGPIHAGRRRASTAEELMRSRYSAYCTLDREYLQSSWDPATRPLMITLVAETLWLGLNIVDVVDGAPTDDEGIVEFIASYQQGNQTGAVHERSHFRRDGSQWFYVGAEGE